MIPTHESASGITPSLAALDDATSLKQREWFCSEPGEDIPCQYTSIEGRLTPSTPRGEDMRLEPSLNVTPEGSLIDIPTVVKREKREEVSEKEMLGTFSETTYLEIPNTCVKTVHKSPTREAPKIIQRTKEVSREEALTTTRQFFAVVEIPDIPTTTIATTTSIATPPVTLDVEPRGTSSPRINLPEGFPSCPTITATCRPRIWMQQLTEGQTTEPRREDASVSESNTSLVETLLEDIPDELGHEWRILHPFELPGVKFPTDTMPPNQRRLAENDALVELIQTTEYLDDIPTWGQRRL